MTIPADRLIGQEGDGWRQVTGELALERSGPERILSTFHLFAALVEAAGPEPEPRLAEAIGRLTAELYALRAMSLAVAGQLEKGEFPEVEAAIVKDMGTRFEAEVVETLRRAVPVEPVAGGSANAPSLEVRAGRLGAGAALVHAAGRHQRDPALDHRARPRGQVRGNPMSDETARLVEQIADDLFAAESEAARAALVQKAPGPSGSGRPSPRPGSRRRHCRRRRAAPASRRARGAARGGAPCRADPGGRDDGGNPALPPSPGIEAPDGPLTLYAPPTGSWPLGRR